MRTGGLRRCVLLLEGRKFQCLECWRYSRQRFAGNLPCQRASEAFRQMIFQQHLEGINRSRLGRREGIGAATVERYWGFRRRRTIIPEGTRTAFRAEGERSTGQENVRSSGDYYS